MAKSLDKLNLWPSPDSNNMVVDICRKIPITTAFIMVKYIGGIDVVLETKVPKGVMAVKMRMNANACSLI